MNSELWILLVSILAKLCIGDVSTPRTSEITTFGANIVCGNLLCAHPAKCMNGSDSSLICQCGVGFIGETCHEDQDECSTGDSACFFRGFCHNTVGSYRCECLHGWENTGHCDKATHPPEDRKCVPGHMGELCFDTCLNDSMCGSGECKKRGQRLSCVCKLGWRGGNCTDDIDECTAHHCDDAGTCVNTQGSFHCACAPGWQGVTCSDDIDECTLNTCQNAGNCTNLNGSYSCTCAAGWQGQNCTDDNHDCTNNPSLNSGTCYNTPGGDKEVIIGAVVGSLTGIAVIAAIVLFVKYRCMRQRVTDFDRSKPKDECIHEETSKGNKCPVSP